MANAAGGSMEKLNNERESAMKEQQETTKAEEVSKVEAEQRPDEGAEQKPAASSEQEPDDIVDAQVEDAVTGDEASEESSGDGQARDDVEASVSEIPPSSGRVSVDNIGVEEQEEEPEPVDMMAKLREDNKKLRDQLLRKAADLDNFRKRSRREVQDAKKMAKADLLRDLLPVFDNLERASAHAEQAEDPKAVADGVKLVLKQFLDTLGNLGIERVTSVGSAFDPNVHEAIQQIESSEYEPGTVAAEVLGGYRWGDRLVRASMVVVAKAPVVPTPEPEVVEVKDETEQGQVVEQEAVGSEDEPGEDAAGRDSEPGDGASDAEGGQE